METILMLHYPKDDLDNICALVRGRDSFVSYMFGDPYAIHHYLIPSELSKFSAILDRNVYTRIVALIRGNKISSGGMDDHRWAAAVLAFCQIAEINFQYASSLQEYAFRKGGMAALIDLECFYRADNCDPRALIDFALGRTNSLDISSIANLPPYKAKSYPKDFEKPINEYKINYIFVLKIFLLYRERPDSYLGMIKLIDWMDEEFMWGSAALQFANLLFSPSRIKGMMKQGSLEDIQNIAWDFALIQHWRSCTIEGIEKYEPVLLITGDKVVKFIAQRLMAADEDEFKEQFLNHWNTKIEHGRAAFNRYLERHQKALDNPELRRLQSDLEFDEIAKELESELGLPE